LENIRAQPLAWTARRADVLDADAAVLPVGGDACPRACVGFGRLGPDAADVLPLVDVPQHRILRPPRRCGERRDLTVERRALRLTVGDVGQRRLNAAGPGALPRPLPRRAADAARPRNGPPLKMPILLRQPPPPHPPR